MEKRNLTELLKYGKWPKMGIFRPREDKGKSKKHEPQRAQRKGKKTFHAKAQRRGGKAKKNGLWP